MEKNTEENKQETPEIDASGMSLREALETALEVNKDDGSTQGVEQADRPAPTGAESSPDTGGDGASAKASETEPTLQPPAEFTADEKADFLQLTRKQQEAQLRLHRSRLSRLEEIKQEAQKLNQAKGEYEHVKDLAKKLEPYIKARGHKEPAEVAMQKAVALYLETVADPKKSAAAILRARGLPVPKDLLDQPDDVDPKLTPLQEKLNAIENRLAQSDQKEAAARLQEQAAALNQVWSAFEQTKNGAGAFRFPDIRPETGETGLTLASKIGSLVGGQSPLSQQFLAIVRDKDPNATYETLLTEAYKFLGGRIDDSEPTKTRNTQQHLIKSNRAAASVPGRGVASSTGTVKKYRTYREALEAAKAELEG